MLCNITFSDHSKVSGNSIKMTAIIQSVYTLTMNPAIDKSILVPVLDPDRKLRCKVQKYEPGGGGVNVSRALKNLGGSSECWFPAGGSHGMFFNHLLLQKDIQGRQFRIEGETRENIIVLEESKGFQYLLDTDGPTVSEAGWLPVLNAIKALDKRSCFVASGSLPPGVPRDFYGLVAGMLRKKSIKLILDAPGELLEPALKHGVFLIKPNLKEFCTLTDAAPDHPDKIKLEARLLVKSKCCDVVVISLGPEGAVFADSNSCEHIPAPMVARNSTIGAGDSMVAGILYRLMSGSSVATAVRYGVACGASATVNIGNSLCTREQADLFFDRIISRDGYVPSSLT